MSWFSIRTVGIELDDRALHVVALHSTREKIKNIHTTSTPIPPNMVENGIIQDYEGLYQYLKPYRNQWRAQSRRWNMVAPSQHVVNRYIRIPNIQGGALRSLIRNEVAYHLHFPFHDPLWDYHDMGSSELEDGKRDIMISAVSNQVIVNHLEFFRKLDINISSVDIRGAALLRALVLAVPSGTFPESFAIVYIGQTFSDFMMYYHGELRFVRNIPHPEVKDIKLFVSDLHNEWVRTVNFYKFSVLKKEVSPSIIYVTGDFPTLIEEILNHPSSDSAWNYSPIKAGPYLSSPLEVPASCMTAFGLALKKKGYRI